MLKSKNPNIKTLYLNDTNFNQVTGIQYLINVGDINSDKKDEIAVMSDCITIAGTINVCSIYSYYGDKWRKVLSFWVHGPFFDMDNAEDVKKSKIKTEIPEYLEKKNGVWYYFDYVWNARDGIDASKMRPLKIK
jgi:hypothetical protein